MATAVVKETIYVCGGHNGTDSLSSVEAYRPEWRCWISRASMQIPRGAAAGTSIDDQIFGESNNSNKLFNNNFTICFSSWWT